MEIKVQPGEVDVQPREYVAGKVVGKDDEYVLAQRSGSSVADSLVLVARGCDALIQKAVVDLMYKKSALVPAGDDVLVNAVSGTRVYDINAGGELEEVLIEPISEKGFSRAIDLFESVRDYPQIFGNREFS